MGLGSVPWAAVLAPKSRNDIYQVIEAIGLFFQKNRLVRHDRRAVVPALLPPEQRRQGHRFHLRPPDEIDLLLLREPFHELERRIRRLIGRVHLGDNHGAFRLIADLAEFRSRIEPGRAAGEPPGTAAERLFPKGKAGNHPGLRPKLGQNRLGQRALIDAAHD